MFKKILVPIDIEEDSREEIRYASKLAKVHGASLIFVLVAEPFVADSVYEKYDIDPISSNERRKFYSFRPTHSSISHRHLIRRGEPGTEIVAAAMGQDCDLIVMATSARKGFMKWVLGSVAESVLRNAPCPVMAFPRGIAESSINSVSASELPNAADDVGTKPSKTTVPNNGISVPAETEMTEVVEFFSKFPDKTGLVVTECQHRIIGVISRQHAEQYSEQVQRLQDKDPTVLSELYKTDRYGMYRLNDHSYELAKPHADPRFLVVEREHQSIDTIFSENQEVLYIVLLDDNHQPVDVITRSEVDCKV